MIEEGRYNVVSRFTQYFKPGGDFLVHSSNIKYIWFLFVINHCDYSTELKGLGADFVFGFVQSMDGERDPRNLLLVFQIAKNIIHHGYDLGELILYIASYRATYCSVASTPMCLTRVFLPNILFALR